MSDKPFTRGDEVIVQSRGAGGRTITEFGKVKEMAGARNVCVSIEGRDRIVNTKNVAKKPALGIVAPAHFEPVSTNLRDVGVALRAVRHQRNITIELMATMLKLSPSELSSYESGSEIPGDDTVLRLADIFSLPLDPLVASLEYSKKKKIEREAEAAELARQVEVKRMAAEREKQAREAEEAEQRRREEDRARSIEVFCESLMTFVPLPLGADDRKLWYVHARALHALKGL